MNDAKPEYQPYQLRPGTRPLLVSMPHSGLQLTPQVTAGLTDEAKSLPDTDWHLPELYDFLEALGVGEIRANYSRYVIDLNRPIDDKPLYDTKTTGLFPDILFAQTPVFNTGKSPSASARAFYKAQIWRPYHQAITDELARLKSQFGYAILFDAHSIAAKVPMLFTGTLPDFNWGTNNGAACHPYLENAVAEAVKAPYSQVVNGRFKGGFITRSFGQPQDSIHAVQLELSQATYLQQSPQQANSYLLDAAKVPAIQQQLQTVIEACLAVALV